MNNTICNRNIKLLNIFTILINSVYLVPILLPFFHSMGLTLHDLLIGQSVFALGLILFDVPTGWLADRWGRKKTMITGAFWYALCIFAFMHADGFWSAIMIQGAFSLAICLINGANTALLYDTLLAANRTDEFRKREGFRFGLQLYANTFAVIIGAYAYTIDTSYPFILACVSMFIAGIIALFMVEPERHKHISQHNPIKDMKDTMVYALTGHREIAIMVFLMILLFSTTKICVWSLQAYSAELGYPDSWNGIIFATVTLIGAVGGHFSHLILPKLNGIQVLYLMLVILTIAIFIAGYITAPIGLALIGFQGFAYGFSAPRVQESLNKLADSGRRATILSTANLSASLGFIPFSQIFGIINDNSNIGTALMVHAIIIGVLGIVGAIFIKRNNKNIKYKKGF